MPGKLKSLSPDRLRNICEPESLPFETTAELEPAKAIIGQPRATKALEFGMGLNSKGYNIFVLGSQGTGRSTAIRNFLQARCSQEPTPDDWLYVYNFETTHRPQAITLSPGKGNVFAADMKELVETLQRALLKAFESSFYREAVHALEQKLIEQRQTLTDPFEAKAVEQGFSVQESPSGLVVSPLTEDKDSEGAGTGSEPPIRRDIQRALQVELQNIIRELRVLERDVREERQKLDREVAESAIKDEFDPLREKYAEQEVILKYLEGVRDDLIEQAAKAAQSLDEKEFDQLVDLRRYEVNVLVDNGDGQGSPVVVELNPTFENLFGRIEFEAQGHSVSAHFTQMKSGALHRANGGYLVMYAADLMRQRDTWDAIKRALKSGEIEVRPPQSDGPIIANSLSPQPVPLLLKVILLCSLGQYYALDSDEEFSDLFKVRVDFNDNMPRDPAHEKSYGEFIAARVQEEKLQPFGRDAVGKIIEHGSRMAEHQCKLSTRFGIIADLVLEADYWARMAGHAVVTAEDVRRALDEQIIRVNLRAEQGREAILEGHIFIDTDDSVIGQVNGLTVSDSGEFSFGRPGRISARTYMGDSGVVHIERDTDMDGPQHEKGVLTLSGYLGGTYAQHQPLALNASLTFEQIYNGVEGDSASSSELYALISSLSQMPVNQGISVTGSVNQRGEVQPIGAVNEKIEGFYDVCLARGLTGKQGVMIPVSNVINLMLREDVVDAVRRGDFHVWAISSIDEGIELLMGMPAGKPDAKGEFPEGTVHQAVKKRLRELAMELKSFGDEQAEDHASSDKKAKSSQ